ncbi:hypothetical protein EXIGLDRAFT_746641 [Exidia glandulosa HHB12029]|uniref:F-box domain-containing protein n=1 Tax=Exidia glandulosa HHB12029 TaxID=1314781 RepID=A0A165LSV9_EXIGL|nr:hypothetical protein EXIGLDRAFT_746641 [Exidia glandulosa HHB12029]
MDRVQALDILAESDVISRVLLRPASGLQRLIITGAHWHGEEPGPLKRKLFTGGVRWPILRELRVGEGLLPHDANLVQVLAMCPNLEHLKCHIPEEGAVLKSSITNYVPRLRFVSFRGKTFQLAKVLPHLRAVREVEIKAALQRIPLFSALSSLLPKLIARDEIDPVVAALIGFPEVRLRLERSSRTCHVACRQDVLWLLVQDQFFGSITSLILVTNLPQKPLPAAPVLRTLTLLHTRDKRDTHSTFFDWQNYKSAWQTPALQTVCFGWLPETRRNDRHVVSISRQWLVSLLQDVFTFSADRRLPSLIIQNVELVDGEVKGEVVLKDLVEKVDVVQDLDWDPWAAIVPSSP